MKITKTQLSELIRDAIENFKPVSEKIKISRGHGRGQSWTNYHDDKSNRLQVTKVGNEYTAYFSKAGVSGGKNSVLLKGLNKTDAAKLVKLAKSTGIEKTAKHGKSKYKKYVSEVVNHTMARFLYIPKKDIKKAIKVVKSMPFKLRGKVEVDSKPASKVKGFYRITTEKQLFNAVVEFLATADIGVKTISKGKM